MMIQVRRIAAAAAEVHSSRKAEALSLRAGESAPGDHGCNGREEGRGRDTGLWGGVMLHMRIDRDNK